MKCRNYVKDGSGKKTIVWFKSAGIDGQGKAIKAQNYVSKQEATSKSLEQKLSVIKGELWTDINYGLPLFDKYKSRAIMDAFVIKRCNLHPDIVKILSFKSDLEGHSYMCEIRMLTKYGELEMAI